MTNEEILKQVQAIIVDKLGVEESEVTESASFTNDLGADSLDTVEMRRQVIFILLKMQLIK